jgi:hypothetical protein
LQAVAHTIDELTALNGFAAANDVLEPVEVLVVDPHRQAQLEKIAVAAGDFETLERQGLYFHLSDRIGVQAEAINYFVDRRHGASIDRQQFSYSMAHVARAQNVMRTRPVYIHSSQPRSP